jgi:K+ transporter
MTGRNIWLGTVPLMIALALGGVARLGVGEGDAIIQGAATLVSAVLGATLAARWHPDMLTGVVTALAALLAGLFCVTQPFDTDWFNVFLTVFFASCAPSGLVRDAQPEVVR